MKFAIIGPHPDDQELAMGGTIALLARQGHEVTLIDMTDGEPTPFGSVEIRARESAAAAAALGVKRIQVGLKNREVAHTLEARYRLAAIYRQLRPQVLFVPYPQDAHPDHLAVTRIAEDARFDAKLTNSPIPGEPCYPRRIIHYFCSHLRFNFPATFCIDITATMETKRRAMECYQSQFYLGRSPEEQGAIVRYLETINAYFGGTINRPYAEPFSSTEMPGWSGLDQLVVE
ncbi:MAG: PIG-L family deacetylase [Phycisphaerae bacterium]